MKRTKGIKKPRRTKTPGKKRTRTKRPEPLLICSNHTCWYKKTCKHKEPHKWDPSCETTFCSMIKIRCGCITVQEKEELDD